MLPSDRSESTGDRDDATAGEGGSSTVRSRPTPDPRRSTRIVLVLGLLGGLLSASTLPFNSPEQVGIASDVYYYAAEAALAGEDFYAVSPPDTPGYTFLYPPILVLAFVPHVLLGGTTLAHGIQTVLNVAAALGTAAVVLRALERRGVGLERIDRILVGAFTVAGVWAVVQLVMGQTTLWLAFGVAVGLDALERDRETLAGSAVALVALVKVFPATLGAWFLRERSLRAVGVAVATGICGLALGALVFGPDTTIQYVTEVLLGRHEAKAFDEMPDPNRDAATARRQVAALVGGGSALVTPLTVAVVGSLVATCYRDVSTDVRRVTAVLATLVGTLLVMPLQALYFTLLYYPLLLALFVVPAGRSRTLIVAGTLGTFFLVDMEVVGNTVSGLPSSIAQPILAASEVAFSVILPPTVGMWLLLAGCVLAHRREATGDSDRRQ